MSNPWNNAWFEDCDLWYGRTLKGHYAHWCPDSGGMPIDETTPDFTTCQCFNCICGKRMAPQCYPYGKHLLDILDDWFVCPSRRAYNFWKHKRINLGPTSDTSSFRGRLK